MNEQPKRFMAASVPRHLRTTRLGYLTLDKVIGSHGSQADNGAGYVFDIIMLEERAFVHMKNALQPSPAPALRIGGMAGEPSYVPQNTQTLIVPEDVRDPAAWAAAEFRKMFGIEKTEEPAQEAPSPFDQTVRDITGLK